jgi:hypothetical protein
MSWEAAVQRKLGRQPLMAAVSIGKRNGEERIRGAGEVRP